MESCTFLLAPALLHDTLESFQCVRPEVREHSANRIERLGIQRIQPAGTCTALLQQTGALEHLQMVTDTLLGDVEMRGDLAG